MPHKIKEQIFGQRMVTVRMTLDEREHLQRLARQEKLSVQQLARQRLGLPFDPDARRKPRNAKAPLAQDHRSTEGVDPTFDSPSESRETIGASGDRSHRDPRGNAQHAYEDYMAMPAEEFRAVTKSIMQGGCLEPEEGKGFRRALSERRLYD